MERLREILTKIESICPKALQEEYDNSGLQVGNPDMPCNRIMLALDFQEAVLAEAVGKKADLIITHHPFLFHAVKSIDGSRGKGRLIYGLIEKQIALFAMHTNLDKVSFGVNRVLADQLGLRNREILCPEHDLYRLVTYVPENYIDEIRYELAQCGAGQLRAYSDYSFSVLGEGCFYPKEGAEPFIVRQGELGAIPEYRVETIVPGHLLSRAVQGVIQTSPYDEVVYDIYPLKNANTGIGLGYVGRLERPLLLPQLAGEVKDSLALPSIKYVGREDRPFSRVAVLGGSGASLIEDAVKMGAEVFISGDFKYHDADIATEWGLALIDGGHYGTEIGVLRALAAELGAITTAEIIVSEKGCDSWKYR